MLEVFSLLCKAYINTYITGVECCRFPSFERFATHFGFSIRFLRSPFRTRFLPFVSFSNLLFLSEEMYMYSNRLSFESSSRTMKREVRAKHKVEKKRDEKGQIRCFE